MFLLRRAKTKRFLPDVFELPGGHIDYGENLVEGLKREIDEEFGMKINVGSPFAAFTYVNEVKQSHSVEIIYFATFIDEEQKIKLNPSDHSEYIWVPIEELHKAYTDKKDANDTEFVAVRDGLEMLGGKNLALS